MDFFDYSAKGLGVLSTLIAIWLSYLQIREINRKRALRSRITIRDGHIVEHKFSTNHNWQILLAAGSIFIGIILVGLGFREGQRLFLVCGACFILAAVALAFTIARARHEAEVQRKIWYKNKKRKNPRPRKAKQGNSSSAKKNLGRQQKAETLQ